MATTPWWQQQGITPASDWDMAYINDPTKWAQFQQSTGQQYDPNAVNMSGQYELGRDSEAFQIAQRDMPGASSYRYVNLNGSTYVAGFDQAGNLVGNPFVTNPVDRGNFFRDAVLLAGLGYAGGSALAGAGMTSAPTAAAVGGGAGGGTGVYTGALAGEAAAGGGAALSGIESGGAGAGGSSAPVSTGGEMGGFNPEGITNPNFGQNASFAQVSNANQLADPSLMQMFAGNLGGYGELAKSAIGMYYAKQMMDLGKGPQSSRTAEAQLAALLQNPDSIQTMPGYEAGLDAVERRAAGQGYLGSGNLKIALAKYGGDFYNDTVARLAGIANANYGANQDYRYSGYQLFGQSLNSLGYGLSQLGLGE